MSVKLFDDHTPDCGYCLHARRQEGRLMCARRRTAAVRACQAFVYDPLKRVPRQEARLPEYRAEDFLIDEARDELDSWQQDGD